MHWIADGGFLGGAIDASASPRAFRIALLPRRGVHVVPAARAAPAARGWCGAASPPRLEPMRGPRSRPLEPAGRGALAARAAPALEHGFWIDVEVDARSDPLAAPLTTEQVARMEAFGAALSSGADAAPWGLAPSEALLKELLWRRRHRRFWDPDATLRYVGPPPEPRVAPPPPLRGEPSSHVRALSELGTPGGPALERVPELLDRLRQIGLERAGVLALVATGAELSDPIRARCAKVLHQHGETERALALLAGVTSPEALVLEADLREAKADHERAVTAVERALAKDLGVAGGTERFARWTSLLARTREKLRELRAARGASRDTPPLARPSRAVGRGTATGAQGGDRRTAGEAASTASPSVETRSGGAGLDRAADAVLARIDALDATGERRRAIAEARAFLLEPKRGSRSLGRDALVTERLGEIERRLARPPRIDLAWEGAPLRVILAGEAILGRVDVDVCVPAPAVSRRHLVLRRSEGRAVIEDLGSHHGTTLAGARIAGPLAVGAGLTVELADGIGCRFAPADAADPEGAVAIEVADRRAIVSLGAPVRLGGWRLVPATDGAAPSVELIADGDEALYLGDSPLRAIDLSVGDAVRAAPGGPARLVVVAPSLG